MVDLDTLNSILNNLRGYLEKLAANHRENLAAGGAQRIEVQHQLGKLTARERIEHLADKGSFEELSRFSAGKTFP